MKKIIAAIIAAVLMISLCACVDGEEKNVENNPEDAGTSVATIY